MLLELMFGIMCVGLAIASYQNRKYLAMWLLGKLLSTAQKETGAPQASLERGHLRVNFTFDQVDYSVFLPMEKRAGKGHKYETALIGEDGETLQTFNHPRGIVFPTTAAKLGVSAIQRLTIRGMPELFHTDDPIP